MAMMFKKEDKEFAQGAIAEYVSALQDSNRIKAAVAILEATKGGNDSPLRELALEELAGQIGAVKSEN